MMLRSIRRCTPVVLGSLVLVAAMLPGVGTSAAVAEDGQHTPKVLRKGSLPSDFGPMVEVRSQSAELVVRPAGLPSSPDQSDQIASATVTTDIFSSANGRAWSVAATIATRVPVVDYGDSPPDWIGLGLGQGTPEACVIETIATTSGAYDTTSYTIKGFVADGSPTPPPANLWTCAVAFTVNDVNFDGVPNDPVLDQVGNVFTNVIGSEALTLPGLGKAKLVKGAWSPLNIPVVNTGAVTARNVILAARASGAKVRVRRSLPTLDVGETNQVPVDVKLTKSRGKVTFDGRSADGVVSNQQTLTITKAKPPAKPRVGKYQATRGSNATWRIDRKRKLKNFKVAVDLFCDGDLTPIPGTYKLPATKVPRHGLVSKTVKDGIFTSYLALVIRGDEVPYGYFVRYSEGALSGQPACSGEAVFTAKWVGR